MKEAELEIREALLVGLAYLLVLMGVIVGLHWGVETLQDGVASRGLFPSLVWTIKAIAELWWFCAKWFIYIWCSTAVFKWAMKIVAAFQ
jgi:hypothetical protein